MSKFKISLLAFLFLFFFNINQASAADRYWVGGTATWDATAGSKWSATSNGAGGEAVPTTSDNCYFDASSTGVVTVSVAACANLNLTGFTGTLAGSGATTVAGSLTLGAGMTNTYTGTITFTATSSQTITSNGIAFDSPITFNGVAGTWTLTDNLTTGATRTITLTNGTFDTGGFDVSTGLFSMNNSNTRVLNLNDSTFTLTGTGTVWNGGSTTNLTLNASTSVLLVSNTSTTQKTLTGSPASVVPDMPRLNIVRTHPDTAGIVSIGGITADFEIAHHGDSAGITFGSASVVTGIDLTGFSGAFVMSGQVRLFTFDGALDLNEATSISSFSATSYCEIVGSIRLRSDIPSFTWTCQTGFGNDSGIWDLGAREYRLDLAGFSISPGGVGTFITNNTKVTLESDFISTTALQLSGNVTFDANSHNVTASVIKDQFAATSYQKILNMGSGTFTLTGTGNIIDASTWTDFTVNGGTSTLIISNTSTTTKTLALHQDAVGSFGTIQIPATSNGTVTLSSIRADTLDIDSTEVDSSVLMQALTINEFDNITAPDNYTLEFGGASTTKVENITGTGLTLTSQVDTQPWFINKPTAGTMALSNATIRDSWATPDETFHATDTSTDVSNNTGWCFGAVGSCASSSGGGGGGGSSGGGLSSNLRNFLQSVTCLPGHLFNVATGAPCSNVSTTPLNPSLPTIPSQTTATHTFSLAQFLRIGMRNEDVRSLQKKLNAKGYTIAITGPGSPGNETSIFGTLTHMAVVKFQLANGLVGDGVVGPMTRSALSSF